MEFRLLGSVGVWDTGRRLGPATAQQRTVLATLLISPGRAVSVDRLETALWDTDPPESSRNAVQGHISKLRRLLAPFPDVELVTSARGYSLVTDPERVDLHRFRDLVRQARAGDAEPGRVSGLLRSALALWRGEPLADVAGRWLPDTVAPGLEDERLAVLEQRAALDLRLGRHQDVVGELSALVNEHPLREQLVCLLMTALHRCHLRTDALAVFQRTRQRFVDELGIEPAEEMQRLYQAILSDRVDSEQRETLVMTPSAWVPPAVGDGEAPAAAGPAGLVVPRQLPPDTKRFAGRAEELAALDALVSPATEADPGATSLCMIVGTGGVGKTTLAVHWAHRMHGHFPDGQLYVNLMGFGPTHIARPPAEAVRQFLDALEVPPQRIPASLDAQVGLYRSLLAGRRMLILLDNALDAEQVRPLLPNSPGSLVLVTSRDELTSLITVEGASRLRLELLSPAQSRELLAHRLGADKLLAEPDQVDDIVSRCAGLPLALSIVAARACSRSRLTLASSLEGFEDSCGLLDAFDDAYEPLDAFDDGDTSVRTVFAWSYRALGPAAARMFRLLGLLQAPEVSTLGAASLAGIPVRQARRLLTELTRANLVTERSPQRYGLHDLLWAYAKEQTRLHDSVAERRTALHRLLDHYLHSASRGDQHFDQYRRIPFPLAPPSDGVAVARLADREEAMAWFGREQCALVAAVRQAAHHGFDTHAWQLASACRGYLNQEGHLNDQVAMHRIGLEAAIRLSDPVAQAHAHFGLTQALIRLGQDTEAESEAWRALELFGRLGDHIGQGSSHIFLSVLNDRHGAFTEALYHNEEALRLYRTVGYRVGEGRTLNNIGWLHAQLGQHQQALARCEEALAIHREMNDLLGESATLDSLGHIHYRLGQYERAIAYYENALNRHQGLGWKHELRAATLGRLGESQLAAGYTPEGCCSLRQALALLDRLAPGEVTSLRAKMAIAGC